MSKCRGGLPSLSPVAPAFSLLFCPLSPRPRSQSAFPRRGRGRFFSFLMQGAAPLASPGLNPGSTGAGGEPRARRGTAIPVACQPYSSGIRRGGLPSLSPARPAFSFISFPYPPDPRSQSALPPWGRGRILVFLCKGLPPLASPGLNPWFATKPKESGSLRVTPPGFSLRAPVRHGL